MKSNFYSSLWPHGGDWSTAVGQAVDNRWQGVEGPLPRDVQERQRFYDQRRAHNLEWIAEICTATPASSYVPNPGKSVAEHLESLQKGAEEALPWSPRFITTMGGSDAWSLAEKILFAEGLVSLSQSIGLPISLETHRARCLYNPWTTRAVLKEVPDLQLTVDFSHWCVVTERLVMNEEEDLLGQMSGHAFHIHARVGYDQGPQVPDPRAPEYEEAREAHWRWWSELLKGMAERGFATATLTPEFGPDGYLQMAPYTRTPVADLNEINTWMGQYLAEKITRHPNFSTSP